MQEKIDIIYKVSGKGVVRHYKASSSSLPLGKRASVASLLLYVEGQTNLDRCATFIKQVLAEEPVIKFSERQPDGTYKLQCSKCDSSAIILTVPPFCGTCGVTFKPDAIEALLKQVVREKEEPQPIETTAEVSDEKE